PHLDGELVRLLQRIYRFMPAWTVKRAARPELSGDAGELLDFPSPEALYAKEASSALTKASEVPLVLRLTDRLARELAPEQPLGGHNVVMVQHMLGQAVPFVEALAAAGLELDKAEYVGVPYQLNPLVRLALERSSTLEVTVPE